MVHCSAELSPCRRATPGDRLLSSPGTPSGSWTPEPWCRRAPQLPQFSHSWDISGAAPGVAEVPLRGAGCVQHSGDTKPDKGEAVCWRGNTQLSAPMWIQGALLLRLTWQKYGDACLSIHRIWHCLGHSKSLSFSQESCCPSPACSLTYVFSDIAQRKWESHRAGKFIFFLWSWGSGFFCQLICLGACRQEIQLWALIWRKCFMWECN